MSGGPLRVVHVLNGDRLGGAELAALRLGVELRARGDEVAFVVPRRGTALAECERLGFAAAHGSFTAPAWTARSVADVARGVARTLQLLRGRGPRVVHVHSPAACRTVGLATRVAGVPTVCHVHQEQSPEFFRWSLRPMPHAVLPCAAFLRGAIERGCEGRAAPRIITMPSAVDTDRFHPPASRAEARAQLGLAPETRLAVVVADLSPNKGIDVAIRAFAAATAGRADATELWVVGEEREPQGHREYLHAVAREAGAAGRVRFVGFRRDVEAILRAAQVFLLPSRSEGMPLSVLEAQASGALVLATPVGGLPEVVTEGATGWLVPPDDVQGFAARLGSLLDEGPDAARVRDAALARVREHHGLRACATRVREVYREVLAAGRAPRGGA